MTLFFSLLFKVIPLYINMVLGFIAGKVLNLNRDTIATLMFYVITPIVIFNGVLNTKLDASVLFLPVVTFSISCILCGIFYWLSGMVWSTSLRNLAAFSAGTANTGYFGLPVAILLFDEQGEGVYIMALLGITLYENSVGFYTLARGSHSLRESLEKLVKLPTLYAFLVALLLNVLHVPSSSVMAELAVYFKGTYTVLGMMIIGLGLASITSFALDFKFIGMTFLARFVAWPIAVAGVIAVDKFMFGFFDVAIYRSLMLVAVVPLAANMVVLASLFKNNPDKAASAVLLSTLFALFYIPLMAAYFLV